METTRSMDPNIEKNIILDYTNNFLSNSQICKKYGLNRIYVQRTLKRNGIALEKRRPEIKVNHKFFSEYNPYSCYWAGFILADGYIRDDKRNTLGIKLSIRDIEHLEKFKNLIEFEGEIEKNDIFCRISISSKKIIQDLSENFSIRPRKTYNAYIEEKIPYEYLDHFIRGYLDGDGTLCKTSCETLGFIGTKKTLESIREFFFQSDIRLRTKERPEIIENKSSNIYNLSYYGKSAIKTCEILYKESEEIIRLSRKFNIFETWKMK